VTEYIKKGLTSERLKSHLQKFRQQHSKETNKFLIDYDKVLSIKKAIEKEKKDIKHRQEQIKQQQQKAKLVLRRKKHKKRRQVTQQQRDVEEEEEEDADDMYCVTKAKEEEERLLSLYLPMTSKGRDNSTNHTIKASLYDDHHNQNKSEDPYHQLSFALAGDFVSIRLISSQHIQCM